MKKALPILRGLGVYLVFLLLPYGFLLMVQLFWPQAAEAALWFLGNFSSLVTVLLLLALYRLSGRGVRESVGWKPEQVGKGGHMAAFALGICGNLAVSAVLNLLPASWVESYGEQSAQVFGSSMLMNFLTVAVLAPVCEEILFRGLIFRSFREAMPFGWAGVLSALLFGAAHVHPLWVCYAFGMGFCFSLMTERKGSLSVPLAAHAGFNLWSFAVVLVPYSRVLTWIFYGGVLQLAFWGIVGLIGALFLWGRYFSKCSCGDCRP